VNRCPHTKPEEVDGFHAKKNKEVLKMRKLVSLQQLLKRAQEDNVDPHDLVVDVDDVYSLDELEDDQENPDTEDE
jgi:hypothetical protein